MKLIKIRKKTLFFVLLGVLGVAFLAAGWSGIPQMILDSGEETTPAATLAERQQDLQNGEKKDSTETGTVVDRPGEGNLSTGSTPDYFVDYRLERQRIQGNRMELLRQIINNPNSKEEARSSAQEELMAISKKMAREKEIENLIKAKGFDDAVVFLKEDSVNVVVKAENITAEEAARISDLVARGTGISQQNIVIIPKKPES